MPGGRPAVMVHGSGGGAWQWTLWQEVFQRAGWSVYAPELVPAAAGLAATTIEDYVDQVVAALAACGPGAVVIGASLGGTLALAASHRAPVAALVLVNAVPPAGTPGWPRQRVRFPEVVGWGVRPVADTLGRLPDAAPDPAIAPPERWRDESGAVMRALWRGVVVEVPAVPTLALVGDLDEDVSPAVQLAMARRLGADALRLHGVSHLGMLLGRRARAAAEMTLAWLEAVRSDLAAASSASGEGQPRAERAP